MAVFKVALLVLIMSGTIRGIPVEPRCFSKYDFEEKVLEKTIRTELLMKDYRDKLEIGLETMAAHQNEFEETKKRLEQFAEDLSAASDEHKKAQTTMMEVSMSKLEQASEELRASVAERLKLLEEKAAEIKGEARTPIVTFNAREAVDRSPDQNQIIVYQTVLQNIGEAYDRTTGTFTAPLAGTFMFNVNVCTLGNKWSQLQLVVDSRENIILAFRHYNSNSYDSSFGSVTHYLTKGQRVWVQSNYNSGSSNTLHISDSNCWNQFSGTLVNH